MYRHFPSLPLSGRLSARLCKMAPAIPGSLSNYISEDLCAKKLIMSFLVFVDGEYAAAEIQALTCSD